MSNSSSSFVFEGGKLYGPDGKELSDEELRSRAENSTK